MILVSAVAHLPQTLSVTGDRRAVIGKIFFLYLAPPLKPEETLLQFFGDGGEKDVESEAL